MAVKSLLDIGKAIQDLQRNVSNFRADAGRTIQNLPNELTIAAMTPLAAIERGANKVAQLPRFAFPEVKTSNQAFNTAANIGKAIPENIINIPRNYATGIARTGLELGYAGRDWRPVNMQNIAAGVAPLAESIFDVATGFGVGKSVAKGTAGKAVKEILKQPAKQSLKETFLKQGLKASPIGAGYGLSYGLDTQYGKEFNPQEVLGSAAAGGALAFGLGGTIGAGSALYTKIKGAYKSLGLPEKAASSLAKTHLIEGGKNEKLVWFKGATKAQKENFPRINKILGRPLNTPVYHDDVVEAVNRELKLKTPRLSIGATVKPQSGELVISKKGIVPRKVQVQSKGVPGALKEPSTTVSQPSLVGAPNPEQVVPSTLQTSVDIIPQKGKLNVKNLNLTPEQQQAVRALDASSPTVIANKEVVSAANKVSGRKTAMTDEAMVKAMAGQLSNRQEVVTLANKLSEARAAGASDTELISIMKQLAEKSKVAKETGTFAGRLLQAQNILANEVATPQQKVLALLDNAGIPEEKYISEAAKLDWNSGVDVVNFYRKFVPPSFSDVLTEVRYSNMLSSPQTHINNITSNFIQTGLITPIEKTITGTLDWAKSGITGSERQYFASQGVDYAKGYWSKLPEAIKVFKRALSGADVTIKPDVERVPITTKGALHWYTTPLRALEGMDQFFKTLAIGGETASLKKAGITGEEALLKAGQEADYRLFRQAFDPEGKLGQGGLLKLFDRWNVSVEHLRNAPGGRWLVPFLKTPTNILKQGIEYSPAGALTVPGAKEPLAQLSKTIIGSGVFMGAYALADSGRTTWGIPTNKKEKELFYAAGLQPYSIKIGDKWVSYSKLGPLAYPIAMASAAKWVEKNNPDNTATENLTDAIFQTIGFFGDQSYMKSLGDTIEAIQSSDNRGESLIKSQATNILGQMVPYKSFLGWITRLIDPVYRKPEGIVQGVTSTIPGLSTGTPAYSDAQGGASQRDFPLLNAISPFRVTQEKPLAKGALDLVTNSRIQTQVENRLKTRLDEGTVPTDVKGLEKTTMDVKGVPTEGYKYNGTFMYTDPETGKLVSPKISAVEKANLTYQLELASAKLTNLKDKEDYKGWMEVAKQKFDLLTEQYQTATTEKEELELENKITDIKTQAAKYASYGAFAKPKAAKKPAKISYKKLTPKTSKVTFAKVKVAKPTKLKAIKIKTPTKAFTIKKASAKV